MPTVNAIATFADAPTGSTAPDSLSYAAGHLWVGYTNGADSTGAGGDSTVVEYSKTGAVLQSFTLSGYVDGLKVDPFTHKVWALQNQDGNSSLSIINPKTDAVAGPMTYVDPSPTRGYDDVVFTRHAVYLSRTNPPDAANDSTIVKLVGGNHPHGPLITIPVFFNGITGRNTVTGQISVVPEADPDSLKTAPNGDLLLTSGDDGVIIDIHHVGRSDQTVSFTPVQGVTPGGAGLDDVIKTNADSGTFYISDTSDNRVLAVHVNGLNPHDYYASVGSLGAFGQVDPTTGAFTALVSAANAPGGTFSGPHGLAFVADPAKPASTAAAKPDAFAAQMAGFSAPPGVTESISQVSPLAVPKLVAPGQAAHA